MTIVVDRSAVDEWTQAPHGSLEPAVLRAIPAFRAKHRNHALVHPHPSFDGANDDSPERTHNLVT